MAAPTEYSGTRLYLGNLPKDTRKQEVEDFFNEYGHGTITEVKLMDGFGFIQYENPDDAKDIVPNFHGKEFKGSSLIVQFARGNRHHHPRDFPPNGAGAFPPRPRRTPFRMNIVGLPPDTSWQDLKDFARRSNDSVVYSDMSRERDGRGTVEFETLDDLKRACNFLDQTEYRGHTVTCTADPGATAGGNVAGRYVAGGNGGYGPRGRSASPHRGGYSRRGYSPPGARGHSPPVPRYSGRRGYDSPPPPPHRAYRDRSPPRGGRDPYYGAGGRERSPPSRRPPPPVDPDYPPARGYGSGREEYPAPRRGGPYEDDAGYHGHGGSRSGREYDTRRYPSPPPARGGGRSPIPPRAPPPRGGYEPDEYRRRY